MFLREVFTLPTSITVVLMAYGYKVRGWWWRSAQAKNPNEVEGGYSEMRVESIIMLDTYNIIH